VHDSSLKAYLRGSFPTVRDVEDVVQESYLRVWKARAAQPIRSVKAFLFTVARRLALDHVRHEHRSPIVGVTDLDQLFVLNRAPDAAEAATRSQEIELLAEAVDSLPARCREIFLLRRIQGVPQKEIAARLGLSEQTVQVQAARGLRKIEEYLSRRLKEKR
jgi:RNA polymerase sigma-70 factor (ECF subfamily)